MTRKAVLKYHGMETTVIHLTVWINYLYLTIVDVSVPIKNNKRICARGENKETSKPRTNEMKSTEDN